MAYTRAAVLKLLKRVYNDGAYSNLVLDSHLSENNYSFQEKKFISALFYGVIERRITLDAVIDKYSKIKLQKLDKELLLILRMGVYQLLYMDSVPQSAAVNESVKLAKKCKNPAFSGFANGVLRAFIRDGMAVPSGKSKTEELSLEYSCPEWLVKKWFDEYGERAAVSLLKASLGKPPSAVRVNSVRTSDDEVIKLLENDGFSVETTGFTHCLRITGGGSPENSKAYREGLFHVQDISSQLCCMALAPEKGNVVLDMCSAPGGKAFTLAEIMENCGTVFGFDLHENRVGLIRQGAERLGLDIIKTDTNDASRFDPDIPKADRILCDVPCSGLGVIGKKPEIKYKPPESLSSLPELQLKILTVASGYLKPGGTLVYSTCSVSKAENEQVVDKFLSENKDFYGAEVFSDIPQLKGDKVTVIPEYFNSDGFFIAKMKRSIDV